MLKLCNKLLWIIIDIIANLFEPKKYWSEECFQLCLADVYVNVLKNKMMYNKAVSLI